MPDAAHLPLLHSAFYRFVPLTDPGAVAERVRVLARALKGSIVLAAEGVSGAVAGDPAAVVAFESALMALDTLGGALRGMTFKHSPCVRDPFGRLKVSVKRESVALGLPAEAGAERRNGAQALPSPRHDDASHLSPLAWRALLARDDVVLLDNRNHFEYRLGHFRNALDPQVHNFRDFVRYVQEQAPAWRAAGRPVAMYCTGGIRCDKTAPWLRSLGLDVRQLEGGILNYCQSLDDASVEWHGDCFVFDRRVALDSHLAESGTSIEQVFDATMPDEAWRLQRARRLEGAGD
jgi:UPF0176 protein